MFSSALDAGGTVKALRVPDGGRLSNSRLKPPKGDVAAEALAAGAGGLVFIRCSHRVLTRMLLQLRGVLGTLSMQGPEEKQYVAGPLLRWFWRDCVASAAVCLLQTLDGIAWQDLAEADSALRDAASSPEHKTWSRWQCT